MLKVFLVGYDAAGPDLLVTGYIKDSNNVWSGSIGFTIDPGLSDTESSVKALAETALTAYIAANSIPTPDSIEWIGDPTVIPGPNSYQTIVSQTGTAAPAVSGGFTPSSTYASGVTFTWARTGAGVYTLTASSAVFTAGKTGVFVAPLQNLNGSIRAVVTSTTVITVTTAVQSLAVLGLLNFTTTNTDALLNGTMIYVQTYA